MNIFKEIKESMSKELKNSMTNIFQQIKVYQVMNIKCC